MRAASDIHPVILRVSFAPRVFPPEISENEGHGAVVVDALVVGDVVVAVAVVDVDAGGVVGISVLVVVGERELVTVGDIVSVEVGVSLWVGEAVGDSDCEVVRESVGVAIGVVVAGAEVV